MTFDLENGVVPVAGSLNPGDVSSPDSLYGVHRGLGVPNGSEYGTADYSSYRPSATFDTQPSTAWAMRTYDPDPFGDRNREVVPGATGPADSNYVRGMVVAGKYMTRAQLQESEDGRAILADAVTGRSESKRGFWESVFDFKKTDLPFFTLFATVGGRFDRAKAASGVMHKVSRGEEITDDERMLLGRMTMEQSRQSSLGGKIGDIVRQAPGFMFEFLATDGVLSAGRSLAAKLIGTSSVKAASTFGVNRGTKILARELADSELTNMAIGKAGANATRADIAKVISGMDDAAKEGLVGRISSSLNSFVRTTMGKKAVPEGWLGKTIQAVESPGVYDDAFISAVSDNIARKAVTSAVARQGSSNVAARWARGTLDWMREHSARAVLDYGTWGTEDSTVLSTKLGLRSAIADSLGATLIEAPIRGAEMYAVNQGLLHGIPSVASAVTGNDMTIGVSRSRLDLEASSLRTGDRKLMDMAPVIATGMDLLEYVSENSGRGFTSAVRAVGLATGLAKPAQKALVGEVGGLLQRGKEVEAGGFLRQLLRKALGTTEAYAQRTGDVQFAAAKAALSNAGVDVSDDIVRTMVRSRSVPEALRSSIGPDYGSFMKSAVKSAYDGEFEKLAYRKYFQYAIADFMARNNFGPEQTLNAFQRMGYDGILGEMYEERYSDFAKGLFGLDDKKTHSFKENVTRAFKAVTTDLTMEDLIAEAVGFAFPAAVRTGTLSVQRVLAGNSNVDRARMAGKNFTDANIGMAVIQDTFGTFDKVMTERRSLLEREKSRASEELAAQRKMLEDNGVTDQNIVRGQIAEAEARVSDADTAIAEHDRYVRETLKANGIEDAAAASASKLMRFAASPVLRGSGSFASKISTFYSSEQLAQAAAAQDALLEDAGFLGESYDMARQFDTGEDNISLWRRISSKTLGIAAAVICGEPALAQSNSIRWASVDEGLDPHIAEDLGNLHREMREKAVADLRVSDATHTPSREDVERIIRENGYEQKARDLVRNRLLTSGVRMFAHSEMLDRAAIHEAEKDGFWYDSSERVLVNREGSKLTTKRYTEMNRERVEKLRDRIGLETFRLLTDSDTILSSNRENFVSYLRLKPGDMNEDQTARVLAADLAGFGNLISHRELAKGVKIDDLLAADSVAIPEDLVKTLNTVLRDSNGDEKKVPDSLAERLASVLRIPLGDMTDSTLAARRKQAIQIARVAGGILTGDVRTFIKHVDVGDTRLVDDPVRTIYFTKNPATGMWTTTDDVRDDRTPERSATFQGDDAALAELVKREGLEELEGRRIVLTPARALTTTDPILMLQKLGAADAVMRAGRQQEGDKFSYARVHPALRLNDATQTPLLTDAEVAETLRKEVFMAEYASTHHNPADYNFKGEAWTDEVAARCEALRDEYQKMSENVLGERGYLTTMEQVLTSMHVSTPSTADLMHQVLGRKMAKSYTIGLSQYTARRRSSTHYVSVDYRSGVDAVSSMVSSAVIDGFNKYGSRLFGGGANPSVKNAVQTFFKQVDQLVESKLRTADYDAEQREALVRLRNEVTRACSSPSSSAVSVFATAYSCGQLARARSEGYHSTSYDMSLSILEQEVKSLPSYIEFTSVVDLLLGGSAFSTMRAIREAGGTPSFDDSGIGRIVRLTGASAKSAVDSIKPSGLSWSEFEQKVNDYAAMHFKDTVSPANRGVSGSKDVSEFGKLRDLFANAGFDDFNQIHSFLISLGKLTPFRENADKVAEMKRNVERIQNEFDILSEERNSLRDELANMTAAREAGQPVSDSDMEAKKTRIANINVALKGMASDIAEQKSAIKAGVSGGAVADAVNVIRNSTSKDTDEEEYSVDVKDAEESESNVYYELEEDLNGNLTVRIREASEMPVEFDAGAKETTVKTIVSAIMSCNPAEGVTERTFGATIDDLTGSSVPESTKDALWNFYLQMGKADLGMDEDGHPLDANSVSDEENDAGTSHNNGAKYLAAFDNRTLDRYLSFYRYVAAQNGREFLAGIDGIRDNIETIRSRLGDMSGDVKLDATFRALDSLFNSETVTDDGVDSHPDREALFTSRVMDIESGAFGVTIDEMIAKLMEKDSDGFPRFRQAAFFLSFVRSMRPENRRRFMTLACSSVTTYQVGIHRSPDGTGGSSLILSEHPSRHVSVNSLSATGSFSRFAGMTAKRILKEATDLVSRMTETDGNGIYRYNLTAKGYSKIQDLLGTVADVLAPTVGRESPILQALTSPHMFSAVRRGNATALGKTTGAAVTALEKMATLRDKDPIPSATNMPPLIASVYRILTGYAAWLEAQDKLGGKTDNAARRQKLDALVITEFSTHLGTGYSGSTDKDMSVSTEWSRVLSAYSSGLPATVVTANTLPERNNRVGSKVVAALQDAPPVIRQFVDKDISDDTGFAYHAFRVWLASSDGSAVFRDLADEDKAKDHFVGKVLPICRQRLIWPDNNRSELLAKTADRDYSRRELYEACSNSFSELAFAPMVQEATGKKWTGDRASSMFVPVYNGDHSAGVILRIPVSVLTTTVADNVGQLGKLGKNGSEVYDALANRVNEWLGMDAFGVDTKRSSLACSEFPGRSMRGVRYRNGALEKGECRIHIVHNYGMEGHNDAFLGTTLATGYGLRAQQDTSKDMNTLTHKLHVMSAAGVDLTMIKSLITSMWDYSGKVTEGVDEARLRGSFVEGSALRALMDYIIDFRKSDSDISTSMLVDEDSMKVGVLNSKAMGHANPSAKGGFEPLMKYIFRAVKEHGGSGGTLKGENLDRVLCDNWVNGAPVSDEDGRFRFAWVGSDGVQTRKTIGELLNAESEDSVQINPVKGLSGETLDFSYADNSLMSYAVANVSHVSEASMGHMPRNNAIDGLVMGQGLIRDGMLRNPESVKEGMRSIAAWGLLNAIVGTSDANLEAAKFRGSCAYKVSNGADPNSAEVIEQATRDMYSRLTKDIKPPLAGIACPLVSSGAVYHEFTREEQDARARVGMPYAVGEVRDHNASGGFLNRLHRGSRVYSEEDAAMYGTDRSLGYAQINMTLERKRIREGKTSIRASGFRYGWFVDSSLVDQAFDSVFGAGASGSFLTRFSGKDHEYAVRHPVAAKLELVMNELYAKSRVLADASFANGREKTDESRAVLEAATAEVRRLRDAILPVFRDHHGRQITDYSKEYQYAVSFDDLQILRNDGTRGFDRSALEEDMPDPDSMTVGTENAGTGLWLAGTTIGLPRTPSYNGSMWCQTVRASVPCTEYREEENGMTVYRPGKDAMVMPDPQTLKILGCDHDGDKTSCYMLNSVASTGTRASFGGDSISKLIVPDAFNVADTGLLSVVDQFISNPEPRTAYLNQLVREGWVVGGASEYDDDARRSVRTGYTVTDRLAKIVSDQIVQSFFDISRNLRVDPGKSSKDFYGTPMARATRAQPLDVAFGKDDPRWDELKRKSLSVFNYLKDSVIANAKTNAKVSTSAGIADRARGSIVSWASVLHLAQFSGLFNDTLFRFSSNEDERAFMKWVDFIYGIDGVSNATFDDIKEQICLRVGWTPGMIDTFLSDMMFSYDENGNRREPPTTSDEMYELLDKYITDIAAHKSRFWMMMVSEPSDSDDIVYVNGAGVGMSSRSMHQSVWELFGSSGGEPTSQRGFRSSVIASLGIGMDGSKRMYVNASDNHVGAELRMFVHEYVMQAEHVEGLDRSRGDTRDDLVDRALRALVNDISRNKGFNAAAGYVRWLAGTIASNGNADVTSLVRDYIRWSNGVRHLSDARQFARSFNFLKADPGSGTAVGNLDRMRNAFNRKFAKDNATDAFRELALMYAANMCAYSAASAVTMQGRGVTASNAREQAIGKWASSAYNTHNQYLRGLVNSLFAEPAADPRALMQLEGQVTTVPFFLAALTDIPPRVGTAGTDVMSGGVDHAWSVMEAMSRAMTRTSDNPDPEATTLGFHKAFVSLYGALYGLASTSRDSSALAGLYYLRSSALDNEIAPNGRKYVGPSFDVGQLRQQYRDTDQGSLALMWSLTDRIANGSLDLKRRDVDLTGLSGVTKSRTYMLSTENLLAFRDELMARPADDAAKTKGTPALLRRVDNALEVMRELDVMFGKPVEISPSTLVNQLFPLYATSVARATSPDPKSRSVLNAYRGLFARLSSRAAMFDSGILESGISDLGRGQRMMDMLESTDLSLPMVAMGGTPVRAPTLKNLSKADLDSIIGLIAGSEEDSGRFSYEDNTTLNEILGRIRGTTQGGDPRGSVRSNPRNRHFLGFMEGTRLLRTAGLYIESALAGAANERDRIRPEARDPRTDDAMVTEPQGIDPDVQRLAETLQGVVASAADVTYEGGDSFTVRFRGGLKGSAATLFAGAVSGAKTGSRTDAVIRVTVGRDESNRKVDVNSPAFAMSFCNAASGLKMTAEQFMGLTVEERTALVNAYCGNVEGGVANFALTKPSWSVSSEGIATLCGAIHLGRNATSKKMFHEYFHSVVGMFRTVGMLGEEDIRQLRDRFGKPADGSGMEFDEEKAADEFAEYVESRVRGAVPVEKSVDGGVRSIFQRIFDALKAFFETMRNWKFGFQFADSGADGSNPLFHLVLSGYAATSRSRSQELGLGYGTMENVERKAEQLKLNAAILSRLDIDERNRVAGSAEEAAASRIESGHENPVADVTGLTGDEATDRVIGAFHAALMDELSRDVPRKAAVRALSYQLHVLRYGNGNVNVPGSVSDGVSFSVDVNGDAAMENAKDALRAARERGAADAKVLAPLERPLTSDTVAERARPDAVMSEDPEIDPLVAEAVASMRAGADAVSEYDPVDRGNRAGIQNAPRRMLNAAANAARTAASELSADDLAILSQKRIAGNAYVQMIADTMAGREVNRVLKRKATWARGMAKAAAGKLSSLTGDDYGNANTLNVLTYLYTSGFFKDSADRTFRQKARSVYGDSEGNSVARAAMHASSSSMAGALMAAGGQQFGNLVHLAIRKLEAMRPLVGSNNATERTLNHVVGQLRTLTASMDMTTVLEDNRTWQRAVDVAAAELFSGIDAGKVNLQTGEYGDYTNKDTVVSDLARRNQDLYQLADGGDGGMDAMALRRKMLRTAADAVFITAAQVKFMNEFGIVGGDFHHDAWTGRTVKQPLEFSEMTRNFGVGDSTLASGNPIIAQWNRPSFIAANLDDWYASTVQETFGSLPVREMMLSETAKLRGHMASAVRKITYLSMFWGLNRAENRKLLRLKRIEATHEMGSDFIRAVDGEKYYEGFTNDSISRDTVDAELNVDQYRDAVLMHQLARALMNGDDKIITGIDRIRFSEADLHRSAVVDGYSIRGAGDLITAEDLSIETILRRVQDLTTMPEGHGDAHSEKYRDLSPLEMTLYRLSRQWQSSVTGLESDLTKSVSRSTIGLYGRFVREVLAAAAAAAAEEGKTWANGEYNDFMLRWLEGKGLVVATASDDSLRDPETKRPYLTEASLCINEADINRMWEGSEALEILAENRVIEDGKTPHEELVRRVKEEKLNAGAVAREMGEAVRSLKADLKDMPWLTGGEAKYLHRLDTMLETVEGAGSFMYHALRAERDVKREETVRLGRHELTWQNLITDMMFQGKSFRDLTSPMLNMIADYFGTDERGDALMKAMEEGKYATGTKASVRTGLVIDLPSDNHPLGTMRNEVATQIYRRQLERRLMLLEGREIPNPESEDALARMIRAYENASNAAGAPVRAANGLTGTQMYRLHGSLPANFTAGHAVLTTLRGLQDSLLWRSALANMLFTPDAEGDPMFIMSPDRFRGDESGLADGVWKAAARWWASRLGDAVKYDESKSGKENAREIFEKVQSSGKKDGGTYARFRRGEKRYASLGQDDIDGSAISGVMAMVEPDDGGAVNRWGSSRGLFSLDGSEALGYARHLFQTSRLQGSGRAQWLKHVLAWSKTMSVTYSVFFPISTQWESPVAAVGALATMGSNLDPEFLRKHGAAASAIQKFFTLGRKEGWIDENFIGYKDIIRMMDSNDPFLSDLVMWAESIGVTMSDNVINPMEPHKGAVMRDMEVLKRTIEKTFGERAGNNFSGMMDSLLFHQNERTFGYLLNATKLAVAAQVALRLKAEAVRQGKAFDPIRDMRGYAEYVDSEVGGVNPERFAWAHPQMRRVLNHMWFSWQWTRTAWEAAGGGIVEDVLFGGHAASKGQRSITLGRWLRMYGVIMFGVPAMFQFIIKGLAWAVSAGLGLAPDPDDDRDKWFSWENDSKNGAGAFNMSPLLKLVTKMDNAYLGGRLGDFKTDGGLGSAIATGAAGAIAGYRKGGLSGAVLGSVPGAMLGSKLPDLIPMYTGTDAFNTNHRRQIFGHFGKQGWEPIRWVTDTDRQFFSKLNPGLQAAMTGVLGFNPANPEIDAGMSDSFVWRMLPVKTQGVRENLWSNMLSIFRPFSMSGVTQFGDAGFLNIGVSVQMGSSKSSLQKRAADAISKWANNDRSGYSFGAPGKFAHGAKPRKVLLSGILADVRSDAKAAGVRDFDKEILIPALAKVVPGLYRELFGSMPRKADGEYDNDAVLRATRKLHRVGRTFEGTLDNIVNKYRDLWNARKLPTDFSIRTRTILGNAERDPFGGDAVPLPKTDY